MKTSETITEITKALIAASLEFDKAVKTGTNPHFKSKYVPLDEVIEATKPALLKHGLVVVQGGLPLVTRLIHESGEWIETTLEVPLGKQDPQGVGSALTYARRYSLMGVLGIAPEDDDGEGARKPIPTNEPTKINGSRMVEGASGGMVLAPEAQASINEAMNAFENFCKLAGLNKRQKALLFNEGKPVPNYPSEEQAARLLEAVTDFIERKESGNLEDRELKIIGTGEQAA